MLENKLAWAPGSVDTILAGGEPNEIVTELPRTHRPGPGAATPGTTAQASTLMAIGLGSAIRRRSNRRAHGQFRQS
jgi:hypothetical protein